MVDLELGDVIFVKRTRDPTILDRIISGLIKWATGSQYSHVAYFVAPGVTFEVAAFRRAGYGSLDQYADYDIKRLTFGPETRKRIANRIQITYGKPYAWGAVIALLLRKKFGVPVYYDNPDAYECAEELVKAVYAETGIIIVNQSTGDVSPQDLWESKWLEEVKLQENFPEH